jgi:hypothetical protein
MCINLFFCLNLLLWGDFDYKCNENGGFDESFEFLEVFCFLSFEFFRNWRNVGEGGGACGIYGNGLHVKTGLNVLHFM